MISLKNNKYIGDRQFYKRAMSVAIPLMIQNVVTNLVNVLDNVMVGTVGTEAMSGVSIVNQFIFIFNLMIFGSVSASGIFTAQYHGKNDTEGVRYTFRFKLLASLLVALVGIAVFRLAHAPIINSFLYNGSTEGDLALTFEYGRQYLFIMLVGLIPWALSQSYASTMRETGDATVPMIASTVAVITNVVLNAILIFGLFGMPALNVVGAAVATVVSRFIELIILAVNVHVRREVYPFGKGTFVNFRIPLPLVREIIIKGLPVMLNEFLWATAITARNSCYATRGLDVVAALNIASTVGNLFSVVYMSLGSAMAIIVGNKLGAGEIEDAKDTARKMLAFSLAASVLMALVLGATAPFFPHIYNTSSAVRSLYFGSCVGYAHVRLRFLYLLHSSLRGQSISDAFVRQPFCLDSYLPVSLYSFSVHRLGDTHSLPSLSVARSTQGRLWRYTDAQGGMGEKNSQIVPLLADFPSFFAFSKSLLLAFSK